MKMMSSLSPGLVDAVDQFSAFMRYCKISIVEALVLAQASRNRQVKERSSDFDNEEADTIVGVEGAFVLLALQALVARRLMKCTDANKQSYFELTGDGRWMGMCAALLADEADATKQSANIYTL